MPQGGGRYEYVCAAALNMAGAEACCLIIANGSHGTGFSIAAIDIGYARTLPAILRQCADLIEKDLRDAAH